MPPILNAQGLTKAFGATALFREISFTVSDGDRIGLIGPNGAGKSTLLKVLAGDEDADAGDVAVRKRARVGYVEQESNFAPGMTVRAVLEAALVRAKVAEGEHEGRLRETSGRTGFPDLSVEAATLSGGWRKRLAIADAVVTHPDVLLLDEPTNHLDLAGIVWLEELLNEGSFACVLVSHDRYFLENVATEIVELNRVYADGLLRVKGSYSKFLEGKQAYVEAQSKLQDALKNRVKIEVDWLRRGPKARSTKAKARIDNAQELIGQLKEVNARVQTASAGIDFSATDRQTKRLVELENVSVVLGDRKIVEGLNFLVTSGMRVGLVGPNGSGKTTLLRLLTGELEPTAGMIKKAAALKIVYFSQMRELEEGVTLRRALAPDSDSVVYQGRVVHVASYATKFLFTSEQLNQPVERLSGGERARVLIAKLMLEPADLLLLDEPTAIWISRRWRSGGEPAGVYGRAGAGDARSVHAGSGVDGGAGAGWAGRGGDVCGLLAVGAVARSEGGGGDCSGGDGEGGCFGFGWACVERGGEEEAFVPGGAGVCGDRGCGGGGGGAVAAGAGDD
jgi:ATP-binding cassette subfamily F protein uup